jgi:hypothetical protein
VVRLQLFEAVCYNVAAKMDLDLLKQFSLVNVILGHILYSTLLAHMKDLPATTQSHVDTDFGCVEVINSSSFSFLDLKTFSNVEPPLLIMINETARAVDPGTVAKLPDSVARL